MNWKQKPKQNKKLKQKTQQKDRAQFDTWSRVVQFPNNNLARDRLYLFLGLNYDAANLDYANHFEEKVLFLMVWYTSVWYPFKGRPQIWVWPWSDTPRMSLRKREINIEGTFVQGKYVFLEFSRFPVQRRIENQNRVSYDLKRFIKRFFEKSRFPMGTQ